MVSKHLLYIFAVLAAMPAMSQTLANIGGRVVLASGPPVPQATVYLVPSDPKGFLRTTKASATGYYALVNVAPGSYIVCATLEAVDGGACSQSATAQRLVVREGAYIAGLQVTAEEYEEYSVDVLDNEELLDKKTKDKSMPFMLMMQASVRGGMPVMFMLHSRATAKQHRWVARVPKGRGDGLDILSQGITLNIDNQAINGSSAQERVKENVPGESSKKKNWQLRIARKL